MVDSNAKINYKITEAGLIPKEWAVKTINEIGEVITGSTPKTSEHENYGNKYLWVSPIDMGKDKYISSTVKRLSEIGFKKSRRVPKGSVLVTCIGSTIGKIGIAPKELSTNQQINSVVCDNTKVDNEFVYYSIDFNFNRYKGFISNQAVPIINKTLFSTFTLALPPLKEQHKIAEILSSVDNDISKTEDIIEQTEKVKKGLMQYLLTKGIGHTKFKKTEIGEIPEEWKVKTLEDICEILDGLRKPIKKADREKINGDIPYYGATGIIDWINDFIFDEPLVLLCEDGENLRSRVLPVAFKITGKSWVNNHAHVLRPLHGKIDIDFLEHYLESIDYEKYITGSAQPKLNQKVIRHIKIAVPSLKEQEKIASVFTTFTRKKLIEENKLKLLQTLKQSLMQVLLTGKVRVKVDEQEVS